LAHRYVNLLPVIIGIFIFCVLVLAVWGIWPKVGLAARWQRARRLAERSQQEDALKHILKAEANRQEPTLQSVAGALGISSNRAADLLSDLESHELISYDQGRLQLQANGRELAVHVVRAHRLWESYLAEQTGVAEADWHPQAERQEHLLSPQQANDLSAQLGHPLQDPHGDAIPAAGGELASDTGQPLNAVAPNVPVLITHIEDEPETVYRRLSAEGLRAGMKACVLEKTPQHVRFWADGREYTLPPLLANNIAVMPQPAWRIEDLFHEEFLFQLKPGEQARVVALSSACRGPERRRLLDLGFVPGTTVEVEMTSPLRDPVAYRVRGSTVALREEQARLIQITHGQTVASSA